MGMLPGLFEDVEGAEKWDRKSTICRMHGPTHCNNLSPVRVHSNKFREVGLKVKANKLIELNDVEK
jgi:hypothetical protein